jgi:hypothetical protein
VGSSKVYKCNVRVCRETFHHEAQRRIEGESSTTQHNGAHDFETFHASTGVWLM